MAAGGPFFELCKRSAGKGVIGGLILTALSAGALAFNHQYVGGATAGVVVIGLALAFSLLVTGFAASVRLRPRRGVLYMTLDRYGDPSTVAAEIDQELAAAGIDGRTGDIWLTRSWLVGLLLPRAFRLADLVGVGVGPINTGRWRVVCWARGEAASHPFDVTPAEAQRIRDGLVQTAPDLLVTAIDAFDARWKADRLVCEAAAVARSSRAEPPAARTA